MTTERKTICFLLPGYVNFPIGGYKIVYEYANRLAQRGHDVSIAFVKYDRRRGNLGVMFRHPIKVLKGLLCASKITWFKLDSRIKTRRLYSSALITCGMPKYTAFIATGISTAFALNETKAERKFYFVQDFEAWSPYTEEDVYASYRFGMNMITISQWLADEIKKCGVDAAVVPNGLDFDYFHLSNAIETRNRFEIAMMWHKDDRKRCKDSLAALKLVKEKHPELHVTAFSAYEKPQDLPSWISFVKQPDKDEHNSVYNNAAIYVAASDREGCGLTLEEAMICGCAVCCTDIGGFRAFAFHEKTALLSPIYNPTALAENICRLIEDEALRINIAKAGAENVGQYTWDSSVALFERVLDSRYKDKAIEMNILYVIDNDLTQNWTGCAHRTKIMYNALCTIGNVFVLQIADIQSDEIVSAKYRKIPIPTKGLRGLNKTFKIVRELCRSNLPVIFYPRPFRHDLAELFSDIKFDIVVTRYINYVGALHLWNIAPLYVDLDDYPMQTIESIFCPKVSPWRRPFFKIIERIFVSKSLKHTAGVWLSNPNQLRLLDKRIKVAPLENLVMVDYARSNPTANRDNYIFTCGLMSYYANTAGIDKFLKTTWPVIHEVLPTLKYYIVGKGLSEEIKEVWSKSPNVEILGYVENIADIYNKAVAAVVPIYDGSGTCIKTLECLAYSRICISTKFGARGIIDKGVGADSGICLYETPQECLSWIQKAINDSAWRTKSETAAKLFFSANYSQEKFNAQVKDMIFNNL